MVMGMLYKGNGFFSACILEKNYYKVFKIFISNGIIFV